MKLIDRVMGVVEDVVMWAAYILLIFMVINTAGGVFFRYVLRNAIPWTEELGRYMMIYVGFFGCILAMGSNSHVGVEMFTGLFRPAVRRGFQVAARLVVAVFLVLVLMKSGEQLGELRIQRSSALEIPMVVPYFAVTIGMALMLLEDLVHLLRLFIRRGTP